MNSPNSVASIKYSGQCCFSASIIRSLHRLELRSGSSALQADAYKLPDEQFTAGARPISQDLVGFWLLEVTSLLYIVMTVNFFVSGHMFPIDLLPAWWVRALKLLPMQYMAYFPAAVVLGKVRGEELEGTSRRISLEVWVEKDDDRHTPVTVGTASALLPA